MMQNCKKNHRAYSEKSQKLSKTQQWQIFLKKDENIIKTEAQKICMC